MSGEVRPPKQEPAGSGFESLGRQEPVTKAGPAFARAIAECIDRPVPEAAGGHYIVSLDLGGAVTVWFPEVGHVRLDGDGATAQNIRGLLLALHIGAIA